MSPRERQGRINIKEGLYSSNQVLITGANAGIGLGLSEAFARNGAHIIGLDRNIVGFIDTLAAFPKTSFQVDITDDTALVDVAQVLQRSAERSQKGLDLLILNAGIGQSKRGLNITPAEQARIHRTNVDGTIATFTRFRLSLSDCATVVFMSSDLIMAEPTDLPFYTASKRAVADFALQQAAVNPKLRIITLLPGPVDTRLFSRTKTPAQVRRIEAGVGIQLPAEFARVVTETVIPNPLRFPSGSLVRVYRDQVELVDPRSLP